MKKIILALLALALSISLCACGGNTDTDDTENTTTGEKTIETTESTTETTNTSATTETTVQTESEEEKQLKATKARYDKAKENLADYLEDGYCYVSGQGTLRNNAALEYLYKEFEACGDYENSAEILSRFTVFPDMLTSITNTTTDNLGNVKESTYETYKYDEKGTSQNDPILELLGISGYAYDFEYAYDDTDRIISVKLVMYDSLSAIITPEYDESGNIVKATIQTNDSTYTNTYTYDEQNYLIAAEKYVCDSWGDWNSTPYSYTYSYDANGNLAEESYSYTDYYEYTTTYIYNENDDLINKVFYGYGQNSNGDLIKMVDDSYGYEYDANGYLVMKKETYTKYPGKDYERQTITQFLYTNDENGRPISAELIETVDGKNYYASQILTYNYETLYFYNAE
ncbi:MAG: hypothetical protein IJW87_05325 [Clostridia bacterium]|nr:hypothetical protein [Clostridia bacterium]